MATAWPARARCAPTIEPMAPAPRMAKFELRHGHGARPLRAPRRCPASGRVLRFGFRRVALQYLAVAADEKLLEVPADVTGECRRPRPSGSRTPGWRVRAVHLELLAQRKGHPVAWCGRNSTISASLPGSWPANWLQGKPTTVKSSAASSRCSSSRPWYCGVSPQRLATLTASVTLPRSAPSRSAAAVDLRAPRCRRTRSCGVLLRAGP